MRGISLDLQCLIWTKSKSYEYISNITVLFGRKKECYLWHFGSFLLLIFLCPEVQHLMRWLFPRHLTAWCQRFLSLLLPASACMDHETAALPTQDWLRGLSRTPARFTEGAWVLCGLLGWVCLLTLLLFPGPSPSSFSTNKIWHWSSQPAAFIISQKSLYHFGLFNSF